MEANGDHNLYLVSSSPRRKEILLKFGYKFEVIKPEHEDEIVRTPHDTIKVALNKLKIAEPPGVYMAADTVVTLGGEILGKPRDLTQAYEFLKLLSGKTHEVVTGVAVMKLPDRVVKTTIVITKVTLYPMDDYEIEWLVKHGDPMDKAGAYAIQGLAGLFIKEIQGSYYNVVGLPIEHIYPLLKGFGILPGGMVRV